MVGAKGFEPSTSWSRTRRASQAALRPDKVLRRSNLSYFVVYHAPAAPGNRDSHDVLAKRSRQKTALFRWFLWPEIISAQNS